MRREKCTKTVLSRQFFFFFFFFWGGGGGGGDRFVNLHQNLYSGIRDPMHERVQF